MDYLKSKFNWRFFLTIGLNFFGLLFVLTIARQIAGTNTTIYLLFSGAWFLILFAYDVITFRSFLKEQWTLFRQHFWRNLLFSVILLVAVEAAVVLSRPLFESFIPTTQNVELYEVPYDTYIGILINLLVGVLNLIVAFIEEIVYRYEAMYRFRGNKFWLIVMVLVSSILFGFSHYYNFNASFIATIPYVFAGITLSIGYLLTKNIWVPVFAHIFFNSIGVIAPLFLLIMKIIQG